jgi:glycosyl transferase, family 25
MTVFDNFDQIRIINLPQRVDRRREMDEELDRLGLAHDPRVRYFSAIRPEDEGQFSSIGARGVYESQKQILREAAKAGNSVLILEDDCTFIAGAQSYRIPDGWDIFYGGHNAAQPDDLQNSDVMGAHMMGFSRLGAQWVSTYLEQLHYDGIHPPIDAAYVWFRRANPEILTHFAVPPLAGQRASRSDIADLKWYDRMPAIRNITSVVRARLRPKISLSDA